MIKAVLFDLNGVLVDSERINIETWKELFNIYGIEFNKTIYEELIDGKTTKEVANLFISKKDAEEFIEKKDELWNNIYEKMGINVFKDTIPFLRYLRKKEIKTAIVTSSRKAHRILSKLKINTFFDTVIEGNEVKKGKPDPEIMIKALNCLNVFPSEAILIEDSIAGIKAGESANIYSIYIQRDNNEYRFSADRTIRSLSEINI